MFFQTLTIKQLQESDSGEYRCAIKNKAGQGESLYGFTLRVWGKDKDFPIIHVPYFRFFNYQLVINSAILQLTR